MNTIFMNDEGFLTVKTKFGNIIIEQSENETSVFFENISKGIHSRVEDKSTSTSTIISMVKDE